MIGSNDPIFFVHCELIIESNATCADNKDIAIYEHRVSHRIQGSSTFLFRF